jgi:uncharacterized membrane protein YkvA (DUF1232 family)
MKKIKSIKMAANLYNLFADEVKSVRFRRHYSEATFGEKLKHVAKAAGKKVIYPALLLHYMLKSDTVPLRVKLSLSAALGYFILPIDFIPDFAPLLGFTDDLGVLALIIRQMAVYITPEIRNQAREHLRKWFEETDPQELDEYEQEYAKS